jgi:hypothetical protein
MTLKRDIKGRSKQVGVSYFCGHLTQFLSAISLCTSCSSPVQYTTSLLYSPTFGPEKGHHSSLFILVRNCLFVQWPHPVYQLTLLLPKISLSFPAFYWPAQTLPLLTIPACCVHAPFLSVIHSTLKMEAA